MGRAAPILPDSARSAFDRFQLAGGRVHPVTDLFPLMSDDELQELADDIKVNGLLYPIILDENGVLIDGRNRLRACEMADRVPVFETIESQHAVTYILSANISRRHLSKGQQAMVVAKARRVLPQNMRDAARGVGVSASRLAYAEVILQYAPDLADGVIGGSQTLDKAYEEAQRRKAAAKSADTLMARLRDEGIDLHDLVVEERMTLSEAIALLDARVQKERDRRQRHTHQFVSSLVLLTDFSRAATPENFVEQTYDFAANGMRADPTIFTPASLKAASKWLSGLARFIEDHQIEL